MRDPDSSSRRPPEPPPAGTGGSVLPVGDPSLSSALRFLSALALTSSVTCFLLAATPAGAGAQQTVVVSADRENFRLEPNGTQLATVNQGTRLDVVGRRGSWRQVTLSGWIWTPSTSSTRQKGFDLVVSAEGGENLRKEPNGRAPVAARLLEGCLLDRVETRGNWTRVRRTAWIWAPSVEAADVAAGGDGEGGGGDEGNGDASSGRRPSLPDRLVVGERAAGLFVSPDGDTLAVARPGADLSVLDREGAWTRVRLEGWVRSSEVAGPDSASAGADLTVADLKANPEQYRDRRVRWTLQFVSLERAEPVRTDFDEGEPFILARPPRDSEGFVYVTVPQELLADVKKLEPLQEIHVVARVRTGSSSLMGAPVVELLEFRPGRAP